MVGSFLEMTLVPDIDLRNATIPIFFDMMQELQFARGYLIVLRYLYDKIKLRKALTAI